jgi:hypothetical protein
VQHQDIKTPTPPTNNLSKAVQLVTSALKELIPDRQHRPVMTTCR